MQFNKIIHLRMLAKNHPFTCCLAAKHQNAENLGLQTYDKKPVDIFYNTVWALNLAPQNKFTKWCSFAKFLNSGREKLTT